MKKNTRLQMPTASMVVSIAALVLAVSGSAIAAGGLVNGDKLIAKNSLSGNRLRNHTITGTQIDLSKLGKVPSAQVADQAGQAMSAGKAANALALGGIPASGYTRNDCSSLTGQIKGWVSVPASSSFAPSLTAVGGYNCSGQPVQARRLFKGVYEVKFVGSPVGIATGTVQTTCTCILSVSWNSPGDFTVSVYSLGAADFTDESFALITP